MKFRHIATCALLAAMSCAASADDETGCASLIGATNSASPPGFRMRDGEPVDLISNAKTVHGTLLVFTDGSAFRAYWQPNGSAEKYVLANAGENTVRLVSTPPQGTRAKSGEPGTAVAPQRVVSCPAL
ncbi:MAG TPA: hypothetical protein VGM85_00090 [Paraburkholderia sp.]|jgi:hypothetical protein